MKISEVFLGYKGDEEDTIVQDLKEFGFDCEQQFRDVQGALDAVEAFLQDDRNFNKNRTQHTGGHNESADRRRAEIEAGLQERRTGRASFAHSLDFEGLVSRYEKEHGVTHGKAILAIARENPEAHGAYLQRLNQ